MARAEWGFIGRAKWWSYRRSTVFICSINIGVALYVLHTLYTSLYNYPLNDPQNVVRYTPDQIRKMEESLQIRKELEPTELIEVVKQVKKDFVSEERITDLPQPIKQKITDEILRRLRGLDASANATVQNEVVKLWRKEKLKEARKLARGKTSNSTTASKEAGILARALKSHWAELREEIGLWIPVDIISEEHDDKPKGEEEFDIQILPGKQLPLECHAELHTDYGGGAVRWGLTHHKESAYDCCQACLDQARNAKPNENKCNIWVYCPSETGCYSPDIYEHKHQECWLKFAENPTVTFKDKYSEAYRNSHENVPLYVPWASGVVSA